ncbi:molybdopterin biosynthesis protein [Thermincola potens]|uniref:Molybdopterin molybdenumtransferase n=1 Tax=Thermincola potens (strain JR) TaxID=635013 RepID=D5XCJ9_THEPJ|nr:molybdopterin biosynthesis protein [Thermincola potens]ADG81625.1 molybdenum cofactor synthesis domain protein [Thermincola potens JR]
MSRTIYLDNIPLETAREKFFLRLNQPVLLRSEQIPTELSLGRVTAEPVFACLSSPHYHASAMDGYAVRAASTFGASETLPVQLKTGEEAVLVDTGDPLPQGYDAVVMIEDVHYIDENTIEIIQPVAPWENIRTVGEDLVATEMILPANHIIRPVDIGAMLAGGVNEVSVRVKPVVAILPTGTELVQPGSPLKPGDIIEYNSRVISGLVTEWGGQPKVWGITPDDYGLLLERIGQAVAEADIVVVNAGSSAGTEDFTARAVAELGELLVHGVAIKPGKPVILGLVKGKPVIGIPGYPVSAVLNCELFLRPLLGKMLGIEPGLRETAKAVLARRVVSPQGVDEFVRVKLGQVGDRIVATPMSRGAGIIMSLVRADGLLQVPKLTEGLEAGAEVEVELFRTKEEIRNTVVAVGSHDISLDILGNLLKERFPRLSLSSAHVGSLGGLMAIKRGECHIAGMHMLDEQTGEYNLPYIERLLKNQQVTVINLMYRQQGFIVARGNPKQIKGIEDLVRNDVRFINRQRGAGTRILLDYYLKQKGIDPELIAGYDREEYTHMAVAVAVASGTVDTGLGILAAAHALDLDFVPLTEERYDLVIPAEFWHTDLINALMEIIRSDKFKVRVAGLGGYDMRDTGKVLMQS